MENALAGLGRQVRGRVSGSARIDSMRSVGRAQNTSSVACSLPHAVVHHDVVLLGHVHDISEPTAVESAYCKRADASFSLSPYWL